MAEAIATEVPSNFKQLVRLVVRGFYTIEDGLIIDMLVKNPCMKEDDITELLRFEKKQLRSRLIVLRNDKIIQLRLKMETDPDGKTQKVNCYYINYNRFVNAVKYKLDIMRKRMETEERDATSRACFKCSICSTTFTDLEAGELFNIKTKVFCCKYCGAPVEENISAMPNKDCGLMLARFNDQLEPIYALLREVEGVNLVPDVLQQEPKNMIQGVTIPIQQIDVQQSSGEITLNQDYIVEETGINTEKKNIETTADKKSYPVWMTKSTVVNELNFAASDNVLNDSPQSSLKTPPLTPTTLGGKSDRNKKEIEDTMALLLLYEKQHEKQPDQKNQFSKDLKFDSSNHNISDSIDSSDNDRDNIDQNFLDSNSEDDVPSVLAGGKSYPINEINEAIIAQMTEQEKEHYVHVYQEQSNDIYY